MLRRAVLLFLGLAVVFSACSCVRTYTTCIVEITPTTNGIERQLTMYRTHVTDSTRARVELALDAEVADRLERIYGVRPMTIRDSASTTAHLDSADTAAPYVGRGRFPSIPGDLNNWGSLREFPSALGSCWAYAERIGGDQEPAAKLQRSFAAADSLTDTLLGWSESELGGHPMWPALHSEIDVDLRRALQNLVLEGVRDDSAKFDRFLVALFEQPLSFLTLAALPEGEDPTDPVFAAFILQELRTRLSRTLGLRNPAEIDRVLHHLADPDSARRSFVRYLARTSGVSAADALRPWARISGTTFDSDWQGTVDSLAVRLALPPGIHHLESNVRSDSGAASTNWSGWIRGLPNPSTGLPFICWATWVQPDSAAQHRLFGDVELDDDELSGYCVWFNTLDAKHQAEWNKMLGRLRPGKLKPLERFRFSGAKGGEEKTIPGRDLLLDALDWTPGPG